MEKKVFHLAPAFEQKYASASAVSAGGFLFLMGRTAGNASASSDMSDQIRATYAGVAEVLEAHGMNFDNVVQERIYTTDIDAFFASADVRTSVYGGCSLPATTWVEVRRLLDPHCLVEVEIIAIEG